MQVGRDHPKLVLIGLTVLLILYSFFFPISAGAGLAALLLVALAGAVLALARRRPNAARCHFTQRKIYKLSCHKSERGESDMRAT
jgi:hypothetical protein